MNKRDYMLKFKELIEKHEAEYDKRYNGADGTTYYDPNRCPMTRGEFYNLMNDIWEELFKEEDEENGHLMTSADDIKPKSAIYRSSFHGEMWYETLKCAIFDEVRKQRPEFTDLEILRGLEDGRITVIFTRDSNWPFGKPYIPPVVKIEA